MRRSGGSPRSPSPDCADPRRGAVPRRAARSASCGNPPRSPRRQRPGPRALAALPRAGERRQPRGARPVSRRRCAPLPSPPFGGRRSAPPTPRRSGGVGPGEAMADEAQGKSWAAGSRPPPSPPPSPPPLPPPPLPAVPRLRGRGGGGVHPWPPPGAGAEGRSPLALRQAAGARRRWITS